MSETQQLSKATIKNLETREEVECMFRPKEYAFAKQNKWNSEVVIGKNVPDVKFQGGQAMTLTMELFFDTYDTKDKVKKDVRTEYTNKIWKLMMINPKTKDKGHKGWPPRCEFRWGTSWSFQAVVTSINQKFTMFLGDGTPVRSTMNITFQQAAEEGKYPGQNPTTLSAPGYRTRMVKEGETLDWIAYEEYGDSSMWRILADTNDLGDPIKLSAGQVLAVPPKA